MEKGDPPSPALSNAFNQTDDVLHSGFQQLIQHNAASAVYAQAEHQLADIGSHMGSNPHSRYSSPGPQTHMVTPYDHPPSYTAPPYAGGYHTGYPIDPSPYPQLPDINSSAVGSFESGISRPSLTNDTNARELPRLLTIHIAHLAHHRRHPSKPTE